MADGADSPATPNQPQGDLRGLEARRLFEAIVADAEEGVVVVDPNGVISYANPAAEFLLGHGRSDLVGEMFGLPPIAHDQPIQVNVISQDSTIRLVDLRIEPLTSGPDGALVLRLKDITVYHRSISDARDEVRRRDEFLAMLSHELRNPLAAIRSAAFLLTSDGVDTPSRDRAAAVVDRQFGHLTRILDDLLDVARILRGKLVIARTPVDMGDVLRDAVEAAAPLITQQRHNLELRLPDAELWVAGDATRLEQIAVNLLNNAAKFTPRGGNIALHADKHGAEIVIRVRDDGPGIAADLLPRIFEPFVQGVQTLERSDGGLGIGLMLVRTFVELHGGSIDAHANTDGAGMSFTVRLPLVERRPKTEPSPPEGSAPRPLQILLVEDNDDARQMLGMLLVAKGHRITEAANGPAGLSIALELRPDVAFLDIGLPGMNGFELARRLRQEIPGTLYLVALTGYGSPKDLREARDAGFDELVVKPIQLPELCRILESCRPDRVTPRNDDT